MTNCEEPAILPDASIETLKISEVIIDVHRSEQYQQEEQPQLEMLEVRSEQRGLLSYCKPLKPPQNWTMFGMLCIFYNLFIVLILLGTYVNYRLGMETETTDLSMETELC